MKAATESLILLSIEIEEYFKKQELYFHNNKDGILLSTLFDKMLYPFLLALSALNPHIKITYKTLSISLSSTVIILFPSIQNFPSKISALIIQKILCYEENSTTLS